MKKISHVIKNSMWFILSKINSLISGAIFFIFLARFYPKEVIGEFTYSLTIISLFAVLIGFGLNTSLVKYFVKDKMSPYVLIKFALLVQSLLAVASLIIIIFSFEHNLVLFILAFSLIFKSSEIFKTYFDSKLKSKSYFKYEVIVYMSMISIKLILVSYMVNMAYIAFALVCESIILFLMLLFLFSKDKDTKVSFAKITSNDLKKIILDALPVLLSGAIFILFTRLDQIMVYHMLGAEVQAEYALASKLSEGWYFVPLGVITSYYAVMAKNINKDIYFNVFSDACLRVNVITLPVAVFVSFYSGYIVTTLYGVEYQAAANVLTIQIWNGVIIGLSALTFRHFILQGLRRYSLYRAFIGLFLNVVLNYILIPLYGISGAAISTLISQFLALFMSNLLWNKTREIFVIQLKSLFFYKTTKLQNYKTT